jgi:hypothetical protein
MRETRRTIELAVVGSALTLDLILGSLYSVAEHIPLWHGIFCGLANAVTDGGDVSPTNGFGYAITALEYVLVVPLFAAALSLFSSIVTTKDVKAHVDKRHRELKTHVTDELAKRGARP